jgi:undecaprenyl-diphosphatase
VAAAALLSSGAASGINALIKWVTGRHRPVTGIAPFTFQPFPQGISGLIHQHSLCFPSGDATLAFVTAASLSILVPPGRWIFFFVATLVALERVLENAHYVSDVIAGAGLGTAIGYFITRLVLKRFSDKPLRLDAGRAQDD